MPGQDIAPAPQRIAAGPRAPCGRGRRRFQASFRRALFRAFWRLGFRQSSFRHIARISRHTAPYAWARSPVCMACYGPLHLSDPGKAIRSTDTSSSPCPLRGRYSSCATWRSRGNRKRPSGSGSRRQAFGRARIPKKRRHHGQPAPSSRNPPVPAGAAPRTRTPQPPTAPHPGFSRECDHPRGDQAFGVVGERAGQDGCGVWPTSLTHRNPESGARSACLGPAGVSQRGGPAVDLIHEFPVHLPGGVEVVRQLAGVGLELADLLA